MDEGDREESRPPSDVSWPEISPEIRERILRENLAAWRDQGLISAEQYARLLAQVAGPARPTKPQRAVAQERKLGRGVTILINLGAIILAAGLIIFFASNWIEFGRAAKIASLFALTLFFYLAGFELTQEGRWNFPKLGLAQALSVHGDDPLQGDSAMGARRPPLAPPSASGHPRGAWSLGINLAAMGRIIGLMNRRADRSLRQLTSQGSWRRVKGNRSKSAS